MAVVLTALAAALPALPADLEVNVGGVAVTLPAPFNEYVEAGDRVGDLVSGFLTPDYRLLATYLPRNVVAAVSGNKPVHLDNNLVGYVAVMRQVERTDLTPPLFARAVDAAVDGASPRKVDATKVRETEQRINLQMRAIGAAPLRLGEREILGELFRQPNAAGFAVRTGVSMNGHNGTLTGGMAFIRVKNRLLLAWISVEHESPDLMDWLTRSLQAWSDVIILKNGGEIGQ